MYTLTGSVRRVWGSAELGYSRVLRWTRSAWMIQGQEEQLRLLGSMIYTEQGAHSPTSSVHMQQSTAGIGMRINTRTLMSGWMIRIRTVIVTATMWTQICLKNELNWIGKSYGVIYWWSITGTGWSVCYTFIKWTLEFEKFLQELEPSARIE